MLPWVDAVCVVDAELSLGCGWAWGGAGLGGWAWGGAGLGVRLGLGAGLGVGLGLGWGLGFGCYFYYNYYKYYNTYYCYCSDRYYNFLSQLPQ